MPINLDFLDTFAVFKLGKEEPKVTPQEQEIINYHNDTLKQNKQLINEDGSVTTVYSIGIKTPNGKFVAVPGYNRDSGKIMNEEEAYNFWKKDIEANKFPIYNTGDELNKRSQELHKFMEEPKATNLPYNPKDKQDPITLPGKNSAEDDISSYMQFLKKHEGKKLTAYKPIKTEKYYTIGYGHYGEDIKEGMTITEEEADKYLVDDINVRLPKIKKAIPKFDDMPLEVRKNILGSWFRGSLSGSPKTIRLINEGKFEEASKEFLNNDEYKKYKSKPGTMDGVVNRMEDTAKAIASLSL